MLFVYGTLRDPDVLGAVLGRPATGLNAAAPGYAVVNYPGRVYPALLRRPATRNTLRCQPANSRRRASPDNTLRCARS